MLRFVNSTTQEYSMTKILMKSTLTSDLSI